MENAIRIALIPAYQPEPCLPRLTEELSRAGFCPIVVDDGSGSAYAPVFKEASRFAYILHYDENPAVNRGKGAALKAGLFYIKNSIPFRGTVVTVDADGQHTVEDALRVCEEAEAIPDALVLGSRHFTGRVPLRSRFGNTVTRFVYTLATRTRIYDTQTGLRAFNISMIRRLLEIDGDRYNYEMNTLLKFGRQHLPIIEVPIETVYLEGNASSHFDTVKDSVRIYRDIIRFGASSLASFFLDYGLFSAFSLALSVPIANVAARVISASFNFTVNKRVVFRSKESAVRTGFQYFALAACILAGNTAMLTWLVGGVGINRFLAKLLTEITFFSLSFIIQKFLIFRKHESNDKRKEGEQDGQKEKEETAAGNRIWRHSHSIHGVRAS